MFWTLSSDVGLYWYDLQRMVPTRRRSPQRTNSTGLDGEVNCTAVEPPAVCQTLGAVSKAGTMRGLGMDSVLTGERRAAASPLFGFRGADIRAG